MSCWRHRTGLGRKRKLALLNRMQSDVPVAACPALPQRRNALDADHCKAGTPHTDHMVDTLRGFNSKDEKILPLIILHQKHIYESFNLHTSQKHVRAEKYRLQGEGRRELIESKVNSQQLCEARTNYYYVDKRTDL